MRRLRALLRMTPSRPGPDSNVDHDKLRDKERERGDRPVPRFPNFSFNKILGNRHSTSSSSSKPSTPLSPSPIPTAVVTSPKPLVDPDQPLPDLLESFATSGQEDAPPDVLIARTRLVASRLSCTSPLPHVALLTPALTSICSSSAPVDLRCAGFDLLSTFTTLASDTLVSIDRSALWLVLKAAGLSTEQGAVEWSSRLGAASALTAHGTAIEGLHDIIPRICDWARLIASWRTGTEVASEAMPNADGVLASCLRLLTNILHHNCQTASPSDLVTIVDAFDDIVNAALTVADRPPLTLSPGNGPSTSPGPLGDQKTIPPRYSSLALSRSHQNLLSSGSISPHTGQQRPHLHRRQASSPSLSPLSTTPIDFATPPVQPGTQKHVLPTFLYAELVGQLFEHTLIPHHSLTKIITTFTLVISRGIEILPRLEIAKITPTFKRRMTTDSLATTIASSHQDARTYPISMTDTRTQNIAVEAALWEVVRKLLSSSAYSVVTARTLKKHILNPTSGPEPSSVHVVPILPAPIPAERLRASYAEGSTRLVRLALRRAAEGRLARFWLSSQSTSYAPSGAPTFVDAVEPPISPHDPSRPPATPDINEMLDRAWGKEGEGGAWDVERVSPWLPQALRMWVEMLSEDDLDSEIQWEKERVIRECLGIVNDTIDESIQTEETSPRGVAVPMFDALQGRLIGETLAEAMKSVPKISSVSRRGLDLQHDHTTPQPSLRYTLSLTISKLLIPAGGSQSPVSFQQPLLPGIVLATISPPLSSTLLSSASYLDDDSLAQLVTWYLAEGLLSPSSAEWLENISALAFAVGLPPEDSHRGPTRTTSRTAFSGAAVKVYREVRDHRSRRLALLQLCLKAWECDPKAEAVGHFIRGTWEIIGDGIAAGAADDPDSNVRQRSPEGTPTEEFRDPPFEISGPSSLEVRLRSILCRAARELPCRPLTSMESTTELLGTVTATGSFIQSHTVSPSRPFATPTRAGSSSSASPVSQERESSMPPLMSFLSSLALPTPSLNAKAPEPEPEPSTETSKAPDDTQEEDSHPCDCASLSAALTLVEAFQTLAFSPPHSLSSTSSQSKTARAPASHQCIHVFRDLLSLITPNGCEPLTETEREWHERATPETSQTGVGSAACPRARLAILQWIVRLRADREHRLYAVRDLDSQIEPFARILGRAESSPSQSQAQSTSNPESSRNFPQARGREAGGVHEEARRSRGFSASRRSPSPSQARKATPSLSKWSVPEHLPFNSPIGVRPSEGMTTYEAGMASADETTKSLWLPTSAYVCALLDIIKDETDWDILAYTLCHLPLQLSNKHLFCGPMTSRVMVKFSEALVATIHSNRLANRLNRIRYPEVLSVAYHVLNVVMSYKRLFGRPLLEAIVETLHIGLSRYPATIKPSLQGLSLAALELQPQVTRQLSKIISQLSQIVTNPGVSIHILELLIIIGSLPSLYSNFTEEDFKRVFTVGLRYIQHHNRASSNRGGSHALSQHMLSIAYYTIYIWFLAVKLPDRPRYVPHIIRNLLIANDHSGNKDVDEPTEVCFDWLARYSYGDVDPKPTTSLLGHALRSESSTPPNEKTWLQGNALVTVRSLKRVGWIEVENRRPCGLTRFYCRIENASLSRLRLEDLESIMETGNETPRVPSSNPSLQLLPTEVPDDTSNMVSESAGSSSDHLAVPKLSNPPTMPPAAETLIDPSFLAIQMSPFPALRRLGTQSKPVPPSDECKRIIRNLDRTPVIDSHTIGILYAAPGQTTEAEILGNRHGSPAFTKFLQRLGKLVRLKSQTQVYTGGLDTHSDEDGQFAYAWWSDVAQILYHTATMMPNRPGDTAFAHKKKHIGNDYVRIIWNDSGSPLPFTILSTEFQFANFIIEPHSAGLTGAYSNSAHELEFFKVSCQRAAGLPDFGPIGEFKVISFESLAHYVREVSLLADFFAPVWVQTRQDTQKVEYVTNWRARLRSIKRIRAAVSAEGGGRLGEEPALGDLMAQEEARDFTRIY